MNRKHQQPAFSLLELVAAVAIIGVIATVIIRRAYNHFESGKIATCYVNKGDIEIQAELWLQNTGSLPPSNLSTIGADSNYFPEGLPTCPVDGSAYTIDASTGLVNGHNH
jgi:prepilin-type N-terminal cleavage/methylation domain-containing protein